MIRFQLLHRPSSMWKYFTIFGIWLEQKHEESHAGIQLTVCNPFSLWGGKVLSVDFTLNFRLKSIHFHKITGKKSCKAFIIKIPVISHIGIELQLLGIHFEIFWSTPYYHKTDKGLEYGVNES